MKLLLIFVFTAVLALAACDKKAEMEKISKECSDEVKVSAEEVKAFYANGLKANEATEGIKCHLKCMLEKDGVFKGGVYDGDAAIAKLKEIPNIKEHVADLEGAVSSCKAEKGANDCETAFKITMCMVEHKKA